MCGGVEAGVAARSSVLCSVTHNSCSVVSLKERINDVSGNGTTGAVKKKKRSAGVCVCFVSNIFVFGRVVLGMDVFSVRLYNMTAFVRQLIVYLMMRGLEMCVEVHVCDSWDL